MAMQMGKAFNSKFMVPISLYRYVAGSYNIDNEWNTPAREEEVISGIITSGNKFSQFDEGIALQSEDGGARFSNFRKLYVKSSVGIGMEDRLVYQNYYYNIIQQSDETAFGFQSFIIEKAERLNPPA